ncbi:MAG: hypothetical protein KAS32_24955 [Candidatus Peribacteraceae bacterium]|nr:hypothetical protein [Candidatus Peribacteraceae bacterium]
MDKLEEEKKIETEVTPPVEVDDEAELDKILEESINSVKAGNELTPTKEETKTEEPKEETPEAPKPEDTSTPPVVEAETEEAKKPEGYEFRIPNKGKFESDESFEKRVELLDLVKKRKLAKTDEQRQQISEDIKTAKSNLKTLNGTDRFINPLNEKKVEEAEPKPVEKEDEALKADKERLKALGGATKEDIEEIVRRDRLAADVKSTLENFVGRHTELGDQDTREVFFDFVDANYKWQGKGGKELMTVLELARENMFKPSESIQDRVLKGANVQEKVNAMQFPGGTVAKTEYSPEMQKSIDELVATGMSEEKAKELISD